MTTWVMIPARGGSVGVPRKNVRMLKDKPLIAWAIDHCREVVDARHIIVMTDDEEIANIAMQRGCRVMREETTTGKQTLDDVARKVISELISDGAKADDIFVTVQPTCPFIKSQRIIEAERLLREGAGSVLTVTDDRHLTWTRDDNGAARPLYAARVNRQLLPTTLRETGGVIATTIGAFQQHNTRIVQPVELIEVGSDESLDIDTFADFKIAEYLAHRLRIVLRANAGRNLGMGHVYRTLALAQELAEHEVVIVHDSESTLAADFFAKHPFTTHVVQDNDDFVMWLESRGGHTDLVILDQLDTTAEYVQSLKKVASKVVTFEDLGEGALQADLVVSDLYSNPNVSLENQLNGIRNAILSPAFNESVAPIEFRETVEKILVVFGGTDPSDLTQKTLEALSSIKFAGEVLVVRGLGTEAAPDLKALGLTGEVLHNVTHMPSLMGSVDLAISSAGRTITELLTLGVPTVCMAQNSKELTHTHASAEFGVLNIGLGKLCTVETLASHIAHVLTDTDMRRTLHQRAVAATAGRSNAAVIERIVKLI